MKNLTKMKNAIKSGKQERQQIQQLSSIQIKSNQIELFYSAPKS